MATIFRAVVFTMLYTTVPTLPRAHMEDLFWPPGPDVPMEPYCASGHVAFYGIPLCTTALWVSNWLERVHVAGARDVMWPRPLRRQIVAPQERRRRAQLFYNNIMGFLSGLLGCDLVLYWRIVRSLGSLGLAAFHTRIGPTSCSSFFNRFVKGGEALWCVIYLHEAENRLFAFLCTCIYMGHALYVLYKRNVLSCDGIYIYTHHWQLHIRMPSVQTRVRCMFAAIVGIAISWWCGWISGSLLSLLLTIAGIEPNPGPPMLWRLLWAMIVVTAGAAAAADDAMEVGNPLQRLHSL
jgi:hypothetical protein